MSVDPISPVQQAIYDRLKSDLSYEIFDSIPDDYNNDFIEIQQVSVIDDSCKSQPGHIVMFFINCWTTQDNNKRVSEMFDDVCKSLTFTNDKIPNTISVTGFDVTQVLTTNRIINKQPNTSQHLRQGVLEIEIWVQEQ